MLKLFGRLVLTLIPVVAVTNVIAPAQAAYGQENYVELLRSDIKTKKVAIITEVMKFTNEESEVFWPIYREYDLELSKFGDARIALIKRYAESYDMMTDEKAKSIASEWFKQEEGELKLLKKYYNKFEKEMSSVTAAKFVQLENQIGLLIELQIAAELPLIQGAGTSSN